MIASFLCPSVSRSRDFVSTQVSTKDNSGRYRAGHQYFLLPGRFGDPSPLILANVCHNQLLTNQLPVVLVVQMQVLNPVTILMEYQMYVMTPM